MTKQITYEEKPWITSYEAGVPEKIEYEEICLPEILERSARRFPNKMALLFQGYKITFRELNDMVNRFAASLHGFDIDKGDSVAILLPNVIPCVVAYYGILKIGAIAVMNNPLYSDRELEYQFNDSDSKLLVTIDLLANRMIDLRPKTKIKQIIYTSIGDFLPFPKNLLFPFVAKKKNLAADVKPAENVYPWKNLPVKNPYRLPGTKISFDDIAMYQYTGGTTGISKAVMITHGNLSRQVQQIGAWFPAFDSNEVMLGALPFFHVFGLTTAMNLSIFLGWGNILVPKPQPDALLEAIRKYKPSFTPLVPTMYIGMLNNPAIDKINLTSIKGCFSGSAPLPLEIIRDFENRTGAVIVEGFGLTEASPVTHVNPFAGGKRKAGSIGIPISDTECRIVSLDDGNTNVPVGESGELIVRGPQVMKGYRNNPEETANALTNDWLYTGDIAKMDEDGYFYVVDRKKDMIISGGCNVYPRHIEEVLYENPKIHEACAIGIPHPTRGESVKVFAVLKVGETATQEELIEFCTDKVARYKLPTEIEFRYDLPKTNVGKILKKELRAEEMAKRKKTG
ncbi:MAG: long-chain fatty acid--CoA ligase [Deltaproteobacteria bacterium]|nr:MAG: long-chain fatty acid--CoA ligase [Deltaproteobacteria bacterium]